MVLREMVKIDEDKCNGCSECVPNCHEGALQMIEGKARLISDLFCDGLGACIGHCPQGAITIEKREAEPYDERKVMGENIIPKGSATIKAHMLHLKDHGAMEYYTQAVEYLKEKGIENPIESVESKPAVMMNQACGCQGMAMQDFSKEKVDDVKVGEVSFNIPSNIPSQLRQWPVQLHLVNPMAPYFLDADFVLVADCTAFAYGNFHNDFIKGKSVAIACPKLDSGQEEYLEKLVSLIDDAKIKTFTVVVMEVPCCGGLYAVAQEAVSRAKRDIEIKKIVVGVRGEIL